MNSPVWGSKDGGDEIRGKVLMGMNISKNRRQTISTRMNILAQGKRRKNCVVKAPRVYQTARTFVGAGRGVDYISYQPGISRGGGLEKDSGTEPKGNSTSCGLVWTGGG